MAGHASLPTVSLLVARSAWKTRSGSWMGSDRRTTAFSSVNTAIDPPIARASDPTAMRVKPGLALSVRAA